MRYAVAFCTFWIFLVYCWIVRRVTMAILAGHEFFVSGMTFRACQFRMPGMMGLKVLKRHIMASGAYQVLFYFPGIGDLQRLVNRMTSETFRRIHLYRRAVIFVALRTIRYPAMTFGMT